MGLLKEFSKTRRLMGRHHSPHQDGMPTLRATGLSVRFGETCVLDDISFELSVGGSTAVVGPNGAGKSTLFKVIAGVQTPSAGKVEVFGNEPGGHICIAYVPQKSQVDWTFPVTVADVVMMGRVGKMGLFSHAMPRDWEIVHRALEVVGAADLAKRQISQLSGGQQQRMFIARALAQEAELMLMDEPLTGLDLNSQDDIFEILDALQQRHVTVMVSLHDLDLAAEHFPQVMLLNRRMLGFGVPSEVLNTENLKEAYGGHLHLMSTDEGVLALGDTCCDEGVTHDV